MKTQQQHETQELHEILNRHSEKRTKCLVYTRVMGYHRPVESFNTGKKGEHQQRKQFTENENCNANL